MGGHFGGTEYFIQIDFIQIDLIKNKLNKNSEPLVHLYYKYNDS